MYCDDCDITIPYETDTCPLCGKKLSDNTALNNPVFPRRNASFRFPARYSFTLFYTTIAIGIFLTVLLINMLTDRHILWALIVGAGLLYAYILIRHTIMTSYGSASKIFVQGLLLSFLVLIIQNITRTGAWAYEFVIPMILLANTIVLWLIALIRRIRRANYAFSLMGIAILHFVPLYWYLNGDSAVLWTMIVSVSVSGLTMLLVLTVFGKLLLTETKRLLHI